MTGLVTYLDQVTNAASVAALWDMHAQQMASFGFDRLIYGYTRYRTSNGLGDPQDWVLLSTQTASYMESFFDKGFYYDAPMLRWALANDGACSWGRIMGNAAQSDLTERERQVLDFNKSMGVTAGYTVSFRAVSRRTKGAIALTAQRGMTQDRVDQVWARHGRQIIVMNNVMHLKLLTLPYSGERSLTNRQREVLQWVGDGKTIQDTATLMGLTAATVEKHLRLARIALNVETTAQAVLKAAVNNQMFTVES